jgi:hypothetical protein
MAEIHVYYSRVIHELAKEPLKSVQRRKAQLYLIKGCQIVNKKLIDISLSFGASLTLQDKNGVMPIEILREKERSHSSKY